ncbi:MAG: efflux RND transporter permease subunit [Desulfobacteraceae bacterium]|nr:MAG: efflux RND transporter permease subunit [Desulfobacteraceae bacterium]
MNIARLFISRPVMTTLVMAGLLLFGVMAYRTLPVSDLPNVDFPTIQVTANLPGADPENMAASVATPLEREFSTIAGIDSMSSSNALGISRITLQFSLERDIDAAAQDVQSAIAKAARQLPPGMPTPPTYQKVNPADQAILYLSLASATLPLSAVNEYADTMIAQRISMVSGVAQVAVYGAKKYAVRVQLDPKVMASRDIGIDEVVQAIERGNVNLPTGTLYGEHQAFNIQADGQLMDAAGFRPLIVAWRNGSPVRLDEIGKVFDSVERDKIYTWRNNVRSIVLAIQRQPGTNTVAVVNDIRKLLPVFEKQLPAAVQLEVMFDRSESIKDSVNDVKFTLALTICLVILVIFIFLRNLPATIIPSLALPMSIVVTFAAMKLMGFSVDNLSLMALTLAVGFVVDDAIVMLENIVRHLEMGKGVLQATLDGSKEISFTILSMTISLAAVFIPVLFMGGIVGRLFQEFSLVITVAILLSGFVSLSLTPMLCSLFLKPKEEVRHGRIYTATESVFNWMLRLYQKTLSQALRFHVITFLISLAVLAGTVFLFAKIPKGFLPSQDTGQISGFTEASQNISFESMVRHQTALHEILEAEPAIDTYMSSVGAGGPNLAGNSGRFFMRLKPRKERKESADELIQKLRPKLSTVPGIQVFLMNPPAINIGGRMTKGLYQYTVQGPDTGELYRFAAILEKKIKEMPKFQDVNSDLQMNNPEIRVEIDRDKASSLGITALQIEDALRSAYGSREVSTIYTQTNSYKVIMELMPEYQMDPSALALLYIRSSEGKLVPLSTVAEFKPGVGPLSVNHSGQLPSVTISFNLKPGISLGEAVADVEKITRDLVPPTISGSFQGTAQAFQDSFKGMLLLLVMAILVIYIILGILYESFVHPFTILSGLPSAGFGALLTLYIFKVDLSLYAFVGIIMLVGIVKKNAIMMIDFALEDERKNNKSPRDAIFEGCLVRFRPIMMTTMAAIMGTLPIAIGFGAGAEARRPLGLAVVGGLVFSQLLTLYITPVYYFYLDGLKKRISALFRGSKA